VDSVIGSLALAVTRACDQDLPQIEFQRTIYPKNQDGTPRFEISKRRPHTGEVEVYHFPQVWGSTALGFGGVGGQALTFAYTTVVVDSASDNAAVYFSGRLAYVIKHPTAYFYEALSRHAMNEVAQAGIYRSKEPEAE